MRLEKKVLRLNNIFYRIELLGRWDKMTKRKLMNLDMTKIPMEYSGKWVALSIKANKVINSGLSPQEVFEKSKGQLDVVVTRIPSKNYSYLL